MGRALIALIALTTCRTALPPCSADLEIDSFNCGECGTVCEEGRRCEAGRCVTTCAGLRCGGDVCVNSATDPENCGGCGVVCGAAHAVPACIAGQCSHGPCKDEWFDCDGVAANGCESRDPRCLIDVCGRRPDGGPVRQCSMAGLSADGRRVLFFSNDDSFVQGDTPFSHDLFLFEVPSRSYRRVSVTLDGRTPTGGTVRAAISGDGTRIAFIHPGQLTPDDHDFEESLYMLDLETGVLSLAADVEARDAGTTLTSWVLALSHNGTRVVRGSFYDGVAFWSSLFDSQSRQRVRLDSDDVVLSGSGLTVALWPTVDGGLLPSFYVIDLDGGVWRRVALEGYAPNYPPSLSFDGRVQALPAFQVDAGVSAIVVFGEDGGVRLAVPGQAPNLSYDGKRVAYVGGAYDCNVYDLERDVLIFTRSVEPPERRCWPLISGDGRWVLLDNERGVTLVPLP